MKGLKSIICDTIYEETGIKLTPKDLGVKNEADKVVVKFWDTEMIKLSIHGHKDMEGQEFAEDLLDLLFEEYYDLREKIVEIKINTLNDRYHDEIKEALIKKLKASKVSKGLLDTLDFEFVDLGYNRSTPYAHNDDEERGYPVIALRVTDFEDLEYLHIIDVFQDPLKLDYDQIIKELSKKIR